MTVGDHVLNLRWCLKRTEAYKNCNFKTRKGIHATRLDRNDLLHLIIGFLAEFFFFKIAAGGYLGFVPFAAKLDTWEHLGEQY